jgi:molybdate transport system substrate-binding protein
MAAAWALIALLGCAPARSETALIAVAANFAEVMERIETAFERQSPHGITITIGSTGKLYAQITQGAPFDVLLAADQQYPERLESADLAVRGSRFTYATGRLVLWSPNPDRVPRDGAALLRSDAVGKLAMANPALAPYGRAARQTLQALNVYDTLSDHIVLGENVGQAHALVATGNAELGLLALSYVASERNAMQGSRWPVPESLHDPIHQDAVLLTRAEGNSAARDLLAYLRRPEVRELIRSFGYGVD